MRFRLVWVSCPDCGRSSEFPGYCLVVEQKAWLWWRTFLTTYDRDGSVMPEHYRTEQVARHALRQALKPAPADRIVHADFLVP